jgi:predicted nucleic acid-binding protein
VTGGLIFDNSPLSHFARAGQLPGLERITANADRLVTEAVLGELDRGAELHIELKIIRTLDWLQVVRVDRLQELAVFAEYARVLGSGARDIGEAATLAWAEVNSATAIVDERAGTRLGRQRGVEVHGTLWLIVEGYRNGVLGGPEAEHLVDALSDAEAWFPCRGSEFIAWAQSEGLL